MNILIISLLSAKERRDFQQNQLSQLGLEFEFLDATSIHDLNESIYKQHYKDWQRPLKTTEVACYYSHRRAWDRVIQINKPILILEDDALLSKCVPTLLKDLLSRKDADLINFARDNFQLNVEVGMYPSTLPKGKKLFIISHVLEHVFNPLETLTKVRGLPELGDYLFVTVPRINQVAQGDYKNDSRRYFHIAHVTDFTGITLVNVAHCAGFKTLSIDEEINGLFFADKVQDWKKDPQDSIGNILKIENTYKGSAPHL